MVASHIPFRLVPKFDTVMEMYGVGPSLCPRLMAEIGDVRRFSSKRSLIAFAGIELLPNDSGKVVGNDKGISKVGSAVLRRTLFLISLEQKGGHTLLFAQKVCKKHLKVLFIVSLLCDTVFTGEVPGIKQTHRRETP